MSQVTRGAMSSQQKRGFRLPWAAERDSDEALPQVRLKALTDDADGMALRPDLTSRPVSRAEPAAPTLTMDAAEAASDVPDEEPEATMIDESELPSTDRIERAAGGGVWPTKDRAEAPEHSRVVQRPVTRPQLRIAGTPPTRRRDNPLVAGLVKAMREAALASRAETTSRVQSEATARVEAIRAESTEGAAILRKQVDDDIATIRDWSKSEMARIRQETEQQIEARREEAIAENKRHLDGVERLVDQVQMTVSAFEADMDRFFGELLAESDPARLATLAEQAPDPPDLTDEGQASDEDPDVETQSVDADAEAQSFDADAEPAPAGLEAADAAEAEAEATEGLDLSSSESLPAAVMAARRADAAGGDPETDSTDSSRLIVSGLKSVAGISAFKGALGQVPGIRSVSVSSGERGVFIFAVHHEPEVDLGSAVLGLEGFGARISRTTDDGLAVVAHEPAD